MSDPGAELLTTRGVSSRVEMGETGEVAHAMLLDYDGSTHHTRMREETANLPGITAVWESSPGSWHVWNLTLREHVPTALEMLTLRCDPHHTAIGYRRGRWTLRVGPKNRVNAAGNLEELGVEYKAAPTFMDAWVNGTGMPQSTAHYGLLLDRMPDDEADRLRSHVERRDLTFMGTEWTVEEYLTMTDAAKESARG